MLPAEAHVVRVQHQVLYRHRHVVFQVSIRRQVRRIQPDLHLPVDHDLRQLGPLVPGLGCLAPLPVAGVFSPLSWLELGWSPLLTLEPVDLVTRAG
jgi:hypothetical protein